MIDASTAAQTRSGRLDGPAVAYVLEQRATTFEDSGGRTADAAADIDDS